MTAEAMGLGTEQAVDSITMGEEPDSLPTTWGPLLSAEISALGKPSNLTEARQLIEKANARGIDVEHWALSKSFQHMMGPAAEARLLSKSFRTVWLGGAAASDRELVVRDCSMAGLDSDKAVATVQPKVEEAISRSEVWQLVLALADALKRSKGLTGAEVAAIAKRHLRLSSSSD